MEREKTYEFIGELSIALYSKKIQITFTALNSILADRNEEYGSNRGLARGVSAAYAYWERKDPVIHHAIAYTFSNKDGVLAWERYESEE